MSERPDSLPVNIWELLSARHGDIEVWAANELPEDWHSQLLVDPGLGFQQQAWSREPDASFAAVGTTTDGRKILITPEFLAELYGSEARS